jgi:2,4-dienoyl-CoA reductase-like NADH-dependent reductase (Old Yellow Enzyme family)
MINHSCHYYNTFFYWIPSHLDVVYQPGGQAPISSTIQKLGGEGFMPSGKGFGDYSQPRALLTEEIPKVVNDFRLAARNAIRAGTSLSKLEKKNHL